MRALELTCKAFERRVEDHKFTSGPVQMARSFAANAAIEGGYDFVVMHDDDLVVDPGGPAGNPIDAWAEVMAAHPDVGMIGAVYLREKPQIPTVVLPHPQHPAELCHVVAGFPFKPLNVGGVGTGFVMIRVSALAAIAAIEDQEEAPAPFRGGSPPLFRFDFRRTEWGQMAEVGEDYEFCIRMRAAGFKVLADPRVDTIHLKDSGPLRFNWHDWETAWTEQVEARATALRAQLAPEMTLANINDTLCIDHVPQRIADAAAWRARIAKKEAA